MIKVFSEVKHNPPHSFGDCHRAAIASILEMPIYKVPHFFKRGPKYAEEDSSLIISWLLSLGMIEIKVIFDGDAPLEDVLNSVHMVNSGYNRHYLLGGESETGCGHTVVCYKNKIVHNPTPTQPKIIGPMEDGYWWITHIARDLKKR